MNPYSAAPSRNEILVVSSTDRYNAENKMPNSRTSLKSTAIKTNSFDAPSAIIKREPVIAQSPDHRYEKMVKYSQSKGLKTEAKFSSFVNKLQHVRTISRGALVRNKKKIESAHGHSRSHGQFTQALAGNPIEERTNPTDRGQVSNRPPSSDTRAPIVLSSKPFEDTQFKFTHNSQRITRNERLKHMRQVSDCIKYDNQNTENVVKYLTKNQIFYENITRRKVHSIIRKFNFNKSEQFKNAKDIIDVKTKKTLVVRLPRQKTNLRGETAKFTEDHEFAFDRVYDETISNKIIYRETVNSFVQPVIKEGINCLIVFHGARGTGISTSLFGEPGDEIHRPITGFLDSSVRDLLESSSQAESSRNITFTVAYFEVYMGKVYDLLNYKNVVLTEEKKESVELKGLTRLKIAKETEALDAINKGRKYWEMSLQYPNKDGSRSSLLIELALMQGETQMGSLMLLELPTNEHIPEKELWEKSSRMLATDLKTIFATFKQCARSMEMSKKLSPFRVSKLTTVLRDYFGSKGLILVIGHVNPALPCEDQTFCTLKYCSSIRKPPGEVLTLQQPKFASLDVKLREEIPVASNLDYQSLLNSPEKLRVDNSKETQLIKQMCITPFEESAIQALQSAKSVRRPQTAGNHFNFAGSHLSPKISQFFPEEEGHARQLGSRNASPKKEKKKESRKKVVEKRANKRKQDLEELLSPGMSVQADRQVIVSPLSFGLDYINSPIRPQSSHTRGSEIFDRTQLQASLQKKGENVVESDSDIQEKIEREQEFSKSNVFASKEKHLRSDQQHFDKWQKFGFVMTPQISPFKAQKDAIQAKNIFYKNAAKTPNPRVLRKSEANYRYVQQKKSVNTLYSTISGTCEHEKLRSCGLRRIYANEITHINHSYQKIKEKFANPDAEIEKNIYKDFVEDYKARMSNTIDKEL